MNSGRGQRQRYIDGSEKTDGTQAGTRRYKGWHCLAAQSLDQLFWGPSRERRGGPGVQGVHAYQPTSLYISCGFLIFIEHQRFSLNPSMTDGQAGAQRGSGTCPRSHSMSVTELRQEPRSPSSLGCHKYNLALVQPTVMERKTTKKAESVRQSREYGVVG